MIALMESCIRIIRGIIYFIRISISWRLINCASIGTNKGQTGHIHCLTQW